MPELLELAAKERELFQQALEYGERMKELSLVEEFELYQELSAAQEDLMEQLKKNEIILQKNYQALKETPDFAAIKAAVQVIRDDSLQLAQKLLELDLFLKQRLLEVQQEIGAELQSLRKGRQGTKVYQQKDQPNLNGAYTDSRR